MLIACAVASIPRFLPSKRSSVSVPLSTAASAGKRIPSRNVAAASATVMGNTTSTERVTGTALMMTADWHIFAAISPNPSPRARIL